jgi:hypothetical protein
LSAAGRWSITHHPTFDLSIGVERVGGRTHTIRSYVEVM